MELPEANRDGGMQPEIDLGEQERKRKVTEIGKSGGKMVN